MSDMIDLVRVLTSATGNSTPITLGARYSLLFMTPAEANAVDGRVYTYLIVDANDWELGKGVYTASGTTLARTTILASRIAGTLGTSRITLSGTAQVRFVQAAEDIGSLRGTRAVTGTSDTIAKTDTGFAVTYSNASAIAVSLAQAGTAGLLDGWCTYLKNTGAGAVTVTPTASTINGASTLVLAQNMGAFVWSDGTNYHAYFEPVTKPLLAANNASDFANPKVALQNLAVHQFQLVNGKIVESHTSNAATFAIKGLDGNDPSATNPVLAMFGDGTQRALTAALSVTVSSGSTLGASNGVAFNVWLVLIDDAGTLRMGVRNCSDANGSYGFSGNGILNSTAEGGAGAADSAGVTYTGTAVTSKQFIIIGHAEYDSGLTTAGAWAASPSRIQLFGGGMAKPGDILQTLYSLTTTVTSTTSSTFQTTNNTLTITPKGAANLMMVSAAGPLQIGVSGTPATAMIHRGSTGIGGQMIMFTSAGGATFAQAATMLLDAPGTASATTYAVKLKSDDNTSVATWATGTRGGVLTVQEIMG